MYPIMEMAGRDRVQWLRDFLYCYNEAGGWHRTASPGELQHQADIMGHVRALPPYARLPSWGARATLVCEAEPAATTQGTTP